MGLLDEIHVSVGVVYIAVRRNLRWTSAQSYSGQLPTLYLVL